jgi:hypothetical protein
MIRPNRGHLLFPSFCCDLVSALRRYALARQWAQEETQATLAAIALADTIACCTCGSVRSASAQSHERSAIASWIEGGRHPGGFTFGDACRLFDIDCDSLRIALRICMIMPPHRALEIYLPNVPAALRDDRYTRSGIAGLARPTRQWRTGMHHLDRLRPRTWRARKNPAGSGPSGA